MRLTDRELATVLFALRRWQNDQAEESPGESDFFQGQSPLTGGEIDALCERLNASPGTGVVAAFSRGKDDATGPTLGPFEGLQLTYECLRRTDTGEDIAYWDKDDESWHVIGEPEIRNQQWSDVGIGPAAPDPKLGTNGCPGIVRRSAARRCLRRHDRLGGRTLMKLADVEWDRFYLVAADCVIDGCDQGAAYSDHDGNGLCQEHFDQAFNMGGSGI